MNGEVNASASSAPNTTPLPWLVVIAASAGGISALVDLLRALTPLPAAIVIVQHRTPRPPGGLEAILARAARMPVESAAAGDVVQAGHIYVARADLHLTVSPEIRFRYVDGARRRARLRAEPGHSGLSRDAQCGNRHRRRRSRARSVGDRAGHSRDRYRERVGAGMTARAASTSCAGELAASS